MKEFFEHPKFEIIHLDDSDVILTSGGSACTVDDCPDDGWDS
jgi:hypothetical protein